MKLTALADPPNPANYTTNLKAYNQALYAWSLNLKSQLTADTRVSNRSVAQNFQVSNYTPANTLTGTDTSTNVASVLCTLIAALTKKNIIAPQSVNQ